MRGIHRSPVTRNIDVFVDLVLNKRDAGDLRRHHTHYDVTVMSCRQAWLMSRAGKLALQRCCIVVSILRPGQKQRHFADGILELIILYENCSVLVETLLNFVLRDQTKIRHWLKYWLSAKQGKGHYLKPWWPSLLTYKCTPLGVDASFGLDDLLNRYDLILSKGTHQKHLQFVYFLEFDFVAQAVFYNQNKTKRTKFTEPESRLMMSLLQ